MYTERPLPEPKETVKDRTPLTAKMPTMRPHWAARFEVAPEPTNRTHRSSMSEEEVGCEPHVGEGTVSAEGEEASAESGG